jgi:hypothetical protein
MKKSILVLIVAIYAFTAIPFMVYADKTVIVTEVNSSGKTIYKKKKVTEEIKYVEPVDAKPRNAKFYDAKNGQVAFAWDYSTFAKGYNVYIDGVLDNEAIIRATGYVGIVEMGVSHEYMVSGIDQDGNETVKVKIVAWEPRV